MTDTEEITHPDIPQAPVEGLTAFDPVCTLCGASREFKGAWMCPHCDYLCHDYHCQVPICVSTRSRRLKEDQ